MIPASYLYKDVFADHWEAPRHPAEAPAAHRPGGPGLLVRAVAAAFWVAPVAAARTAPRRTAAHA